MPGPEGYNRFYTENKEGFGKGLPDSVISNILKYRTEGTVLDIGAGEGRHARFLADKGFAVTAYDLSGAGIDSLKKKADEQHLKIDAEVKDVTKLELTEDFDVLVSTFMLHHLSREDALRLIQQMQEHTKVDGVNAIATFMKDGDIYQENQDTNKFLPDTNELRQLYADWEIVEYSESVGKMFAKKADGTNMENGIARLLARKLPSEL